MWNDLKALEGTAEEYYYYADVSKLFTRRNDIFRKFRSTVEKLFMKLPRNLYVIEPRLSDCGFTSRPSFNAVVPRSNKRPPFFYC